MEAAAVLGDREPRSLDLPCPSGSPELVDEFKGLTEAGGADGVPLRLGPCWLVYVGCLYGAVRVKEEGIGRLSATLLASGSAGVALGIAGDVFTAMAAIRSEAGTLTPTMATIYFDATNILSYTAMAMTLSVFSLALGLASFRYAVLPTWLGAVSVLLAVVYVIPPISWVGVYIGLLITLYVSVLLYRDKAGAL